MSSQSALSPVLKFHCTSRMPSTLSTLPTPGRSPRIQRSPASSYSSLHSVRRMPIQHLPAQENMLQCRSTTQDDETENSVLSSSSGARISRDYQATANPTSSPALPPSPPSLNQKPEQAARGNLSWLGRFGPIELENKGSVARDHLALERTFLAWLRTSLAFASIGIAITQLFRLHSNVSTDEDVQPQSIEHVRQMGKPLGATFIGIAILVLTVGARRFYEIQGWLQHGKFPASRGSVFLMTVLTTMLMVVSLVIVLVVSHSHSES